MNIRKEKTFDDWWIESCFEVLNANPATFRQEWSKCFGKEKDVITVDKEYQS